MDLKKSSKTCWLKLLDQKEGRENKMRWLLIPLVTVFVLLALIGGFSAAFYFSYYKTNKILPNIYVGNLNLAGLSSQEASDLIASLASTVEKEGVKIIYQKEGQATLRVTSLESDLTDPDLSQEILSYDPVDTANQAYSLGRSGNILNDYSAAINSIFQVKKISASFNLNEDYLTSLLKKKFADLDQIGQNAKPQIVRNGNEWKITILPEKTGFGLDYAEAMLAVKNNLTNLSLAPISLNVKTTEPEITETQSSNYLDDVKKIINLPPPALTYQDKTWLLLPNDLFPMLEFQKNNNQIGIGLDQQLFNDWVNRQIAPQIEVQPQNATFEIQNGKVSTFTAHHDGLKIDDEKTYNLVNNNIAQGLPVTSTEVAMKTVAPEISSDSVNNFGIKEIIGVGSSTFAGSPSNRRHNIATGASKVNGILIKPGEEFSLIKTLGAVDGTTGYLTEMVIKDNKTTPEYGGGLCQIGTTMFRVALASGLPITERQNHSYNVGYYLENGLPGVDATIYIPKPDLRFINDTGNYILIQTFINGDNLRFEMWGTKDGRTATRTAPKTWGLIDPLPTKTIETTDLPVGQKKCTESSHKGISAAFDYMVKYATGDIKKQTFTSYYKPWQGVCLIGVSSTSTSAMSTSTKSTSTAVIKAGN